MEGSAYPLIVIVDNGHPLPLADSRAIAYLFDLDHQVFLDLIISQNPFIEERAGNERYALLTADQAYGPWHRSPTPGRRERASNG